MGGSSGGAQPVTTTQTSDPWSGAQPFLRETLENAQGLYQSNAGYKPWSGATQVPVNDILQQGLGWEGSIAASQLGGTPGVNAARNLGTSLISMGGMTPEMRNAESKYGTAFSQLGDIYSDASGQENPYLQAMIEASNRKIADKVNSATSGAGRYGSAAHTDVLGRAMAEAADPLLAQDYTTRQAQRLAATQGQGQVTTSLASLYQNANDLAGKWAQLMPGLDDAQYAPARALEGVGAYFQDRGERDLASQIQQWNAAEARPWEQLQRYIGAIGGAGQLGGTKVTSTPQYQPTTLQRVGGGAIAGAGLGSMFGPVGAGVGGLGGGLLGLLS